MRTIKLKKTTTHSFKTSRRIIPTREHCTFYSDIFIAYYREEMSGRYQKKYFLSELETGLLFKLEIIPVYYPI